MLGLDNFLEFFGQVALEKIVGLVLAFVFCWKIYCQIKKFLDNKKEILIKNHEAEKEKDKKLNMALEEVAKYPQYREQSRKIQQEFRNEIDGIKEILKDMQEKQERRERNKLRDKLLQSYRYYTDKEKNPNQTWTRMESEAFWELFRDYEDAGGDGYIHSVVQPAMNLLTIIDI